MAEPSNVYEIPGYPEQRTRGSLLEGYRYPSRSFFEQEWEGMWTKVWLLLGRDSELPNPGGADEVPVTLLEFEGGESIGPGIEEDVAVFATQQRGFRSRGFKGVYLSKQEMRIRRYHELIDDYIAGRLPK